MVAARQLCDDLAAFGIAAQAAADGAALQARTVALSDAGQGLLDVFLQHPQRACSRDLLAVLAQGRALSGSGRRIDLLVSRLRLKLGDDPQAPRLVRTVRGAGYLFDALPVAG